MAAVFLQQYSPGGVFAQQYDAAKLSIVSSVTQYYTIQSVIISNREFSYSIRTFTSIELLLSYGILASEQVLSDKLIEYKIRSYLDKTTGSSWYIRSIEATAHGLIYTVKGFLQSTSEEFTYKIYSNASSDQELQYRIKRLISEETSFSYNILGFSQMKKDFSLIYSIISAMQPDWIDVYIKSEDTSDVYIKSEDTFLIFLK